MIQRETAIRIVEEELEREHRQWAAADVYPARAVVTDVERHELVWIVHWQSEEYVRTGRQEAMFVGIGPYLVDRVDGGLHLIGVLSAMGGQWEADYRARIRGLAVRTAVDDLHDELREAVPAHGRVHVVRTLRQRVPALTPAQAIAYAPRAPASTRRWRAWPSRSRG